MGTKIMAKEKPAAEDFIRRSDSIRGKAPDRSPDKDRRKSGPEDPADQYCCFGIVKVDLSRLHVLKNGLEVILSSKEIELLKYLIMHRGDVVSRKDLLRTVWGYKYFPITRTVDIHMARLRKKLEEDPSNPRYFLSVYGEGYRFVG
jgi:DNA-binding response OmpR family regulator